MNKRLTSTFQYIGYSLLGLFVITIFLFSLDNRAYENKVYRNVSIAGNDISGLSQDEFFEVLEDLEVQLQDKSILIEHRSEVQRVFPQDIGLQLDKDELWEKVYDYGHPEDVLSQFLVWLQSFSHYEDFQAQLFADTQALDRAMESWRELVPVTEPYNGDISISGVGVKVSLPEPGERLDEERLADMVVEALLNKASGSIIQAPLLLVEPLRSDQDYADAQFAIESLIGRPITLAAARYPNRRLTLPIKDLADMTFVTVPEDPRQAIVIDIDDELLVQKLGPLYPRDAEFIINEDNKVSIKDSQDGFDIDVSKTARNILNVMRKPNERTVELAYDAYIVPSFSTEDAEALNIEHLVSQFTTYHSCCEDRVENIQLVADIINGTYLEAGEIFDMNDVLGERTEERGFKNAGTIIKGKLVESVGGGISQFATTFHNAVYWGGYQVIAHKPHSIYFSRYPVGIEATINWPHIDYIFKNDTDTGLYIATSYTDDSITVSFYGSNDGRMAIGDHRWGSTNVEVTGASSDSRVVVSQVSDRYNFKEPLIEYEADPSLPRGEEVFVSLGDPRWSVNVIRRVLENDELVRIDSWPVHYQQDNTIIKRNPCDFYDPESEFDYLSCA
jgi:vancomycin resistance protein YoaR